MKYEQKLNSLLILIYEKTSGSISKFVSAHELFKESGLSNQECETLIHDLHDRCYIEYPAIGLINLNYRGKWYSEQLLVKFGTNDYAKKIQNKTPELFISYAKEDLEYAERLYYDLIKKGIRPWIDKKSLLPGQKWENTIEKIINKSDFVILIFSRQSVSKRGMIQKEFKLALDVLRGIPENSIFIIPIKLDDCDIPHEFKKYQYVNMYPEWEEGIDSIMKSINYLP